MKLDLPGRLVDQQLLPGHSRVVRSQQVGPAGLLEKLRATRGAPG